MDSAQIASFIIQYQGHKPRFETYARVLKQVLEAIAEKQAPGAIVQARPKDVSSFAEKIVRKGYTQPFIQMTDLCGARVITVTDEQMRNVCRCIMDTFEIDKVNSVDVRDRLKVQEFGYLSIHYIVQFKPGDCLGVTVPDEIRPSPDIPFKAEIQVRTMLQHGWAEVLHDRIYKNKIRVPDALKRDSGRLAAILEEGDKVINEVVDRIDAFKGDIGAYMKPDEIGEEIAKLALILENEKEESKRRTLLLRMAKMYRATNDWGGLAQKLADYADEDSAVLARELGNALCEQNSADPSNPEYAAGQDALRKAVTLDGRDAEAHAMLARSYQRQPRAHEETWRHFQQAFLLAPKNPYHFTNYVQYELLRSSSSAVLLPLTHTIHETIETCCDHVRVGIELPKAHFTRAKLHLLLGEVYEALDAYAQGIRMCIEQKNSVMSSLLDEELQAVSRLRIAKDALPATTWVQRAMLDMANRVLLLARYLVSKDPNTLAELEALRTDGIRLSQPILIVAGGCSKSVEQKMRGYARSLAGALEGFRGTVIGGGTKAGIAGMLGDIASQQSNRAYKLIGYHPANTPNTDPDVRYDKLVKTTGEDFSPIEPFQPWIDIVTAGVNPAEVSLLGINGGLIAGFEYRIALAFGASVGVIKESERSADELASDKAWHMPGRLLVLPDDPMTLRAFVNCGQPLLTGDALTQAAQAVHENFRNDRGAGAFVNNCRPWNALDGTYKKANEAQATYIGEILQANGYVLIDKKDPAAVTLLSFGDNDKDTIKRMAEMEHGRWNVERLKDGWVYGEKKVEAEKVHNCLVPWEKLKDEIKQFDIDAVVKWPAILKEAGIEVQKK